MPSTAERAPLVDGPILGQSQYLFRQGWIFHDVIVMVQATYVTHAENIFLHSINYLA